LWLGGGGERKRIGFHFTVVVHDAEICPWKKAVFEEADRFHHRKATRRLNLRIDEAGPKSFRWDVKGEKATEQEDNEKGVFTPLGSFQGQTEELLPILEKQGGAWVTGKGILIVRTTRKKRSPPQD